MEAMQERPRADDNALAPPRDKVYMDVFESVDKERETRDDDALAVRVTLPYEENLQKS